MATLLLIRQSPSPSVKCKLSKKGVYIDNKLYPYEHLKAFSLTETELIFRTDNTLNPTLNVMLPENVGEIKSYLLDFLNEEEYQERLTDLIAEKIGL